jgi:hypothetical protein
MEGGSKWEGHLLAGANGPWLQGGGFRGGFGGLFFGGFGCAFALSRDFLVMGAVDIGVELEFGFDLADELGLGGEDEVDEVAGVERARDVGEMTALETLDLLDVGALFFEFAFEAVDYLVCAFFVAPGVEDQERFVFVFHRMVFGNGGMGFRPC